MVTEEAKRVLADQRLHEPWRLAPIPGERRNASTSDVPGTHGRAASTTPARSTKLIAPITERNRIRSLSGLGPAALLDDRTHRFRFSKRRASITRKGVGGVPAASSSVPSGARLGSSAGFLSEVRPLSMSTFNCAAVERPSLEFAGGSTGA